MIYILSLEPFEDIEWVGGHCTENVEDVQSCQGDEELVEEVRSEVPGSEDGHAYEGAQETQDTKGHEEHSFEPEFDVPDDCLTVALPTTSGIKV